MADGDETWGRRVAARIRAALQDVTHDDDDLEGAIVTRYCLVAEYMRPDGRMILGRVTRAATDTELTTWDEIGMLSWARSMAELQGASHIQRGE